MTITTVRLRNFMRYVEQTVELHPGFNAIVGQTDAGKSTLLRALIWVFYNKPTGMEMIRAGADEASVTLTTSDGREIERLRSKKRNAYRLDDTWYDSVATGVPDPISAALGIRIAELGPKVYAELNVSRQLDGPFLLTSSSTDAAKILGQLSGITRLDIALASLRPDLAAAKKDIEHAAKLERTYQASAGEFVNVDRDAEIVEGVGVALAKASALSTRLEGLRDIQSRMSAYNETWATVDEKIGVQLEVLSLEPTMRAAAAAAERLLELQALATMMRLYNAQLVRLTQSETHALEYVATCDRELKAALHAAGTCPLCGAQT